MYSDGLLTGTALPEGTVRLTFDDGPGTTDGKGVGPRTPDLAQFLE